MTQTLTGLNWQPFGAKTLIASVRCFAPNINGVNPQDSLWAITPSGIYGGKGTVYADGVLVDNLRNDFFVTLTINGNRHECIEPYTRRNVNLDNGVYGIVCEFGGTAGTGDIDFPYDSTNGYCRMLFYNGAPPYSDAKWGVVMADSFKRPTYDICHSFVATSTGGDFLVFSMPPISGNYARSAFIKQVSATVVATGAASANYSFAIVKRGTAGTGGTTVATPPKLPRTYLPASIMNITAYTGVPTAGTLIGSIYTTFGQEQNGAVAPVNCVFPPSSMDWMFTEPINFQYAGSGPLFYAITLGSIAVGDSVIINVTWVEGYFGSEVY